MIPDGRVVLPELPIIVASAVDDDSAADACLGNGAFEYLRVPLDIQQFLDTITRALADARLKEEMRKAVSEMSEEELCTALWMSKETGLLSYNAFLEERESGSPDFPYVAYADMDDFKKLRRELGGSESVEPILLKAVGKYLREAVERQGSSIRAYHGGGDYFIFRAVNEKAFAGLIANVNQRFLNSFLIIRLPNGAVVRRMARRLSKQPQSIHGRTNSGDGWKIEDLPAGSRIFGMSLDDGMTITN